MESKFCLFDANKDAINMQGDPIKNLYKDYKKLRNFKRK